MFITGAGPVGAVSNQGQGVWDPSLDNSFAFDLANPNLFLKQNLQNLYVLAGKQAAFRANLQNMPTGRSDNAHGSFIKGQRTESQQYHPRANNFDQSMVWFQNMEDPNDAFRGPTASGAGLNEFALAPAPGHGSNRVSLPSSISNNHVNAHARRQTNANPSTGGLKTEPGAANTEDLWSVPSNSANVNHNLSQSINARGSQRWAPPVPALSNEYMQAYRFPEELAHGLPVFPNNLAFSPSFDLGPTIGGAPNIDSSSSSSCRVNGSSPNTVFGSFSSSIGPPDMMDMDAREECFHSPSVFPSEVPSGHNLGAIPQAFLSRSPAHDFPVNARGVFPEPQTVSPKMLHLNAGPSLPSSSSSESLSNPFRMDSDTEVPQPIAPVSQKDMLPSSVWQATRESNSKVNSAGRKQLPDKAPHSKTSGSSGGPKRRHGGDATGEKSSAPSSKKSKAKAKATSQSSHAQSKPQSSSHHHHHSNQHTGKSDHLAKAGSTHGKASSVSASASASASKASKASKAATSAAGGGPSGAAAASNAALPPRSEKDEYLVQSKLAGMTYKEIRKQGSFTEAESTLRGRFRTLTKPKEARVRKPEFQEIDDKLLKRAVVKLTKNADEITRDNVPWKLVAEYMVDHGGSYLFGYTTVRKRWEYLVVTSEEQVKKDRLNQALQN